MGQGVSKDHKTAYLQTWSKVKTAIQSSAGAPELITAVETWFQKYTSDGATIDTYASKTTSTLVESIEAAGMYKNINDCYKTILEKEKLLRGTDPGLEMFRQFRKNILYEMNWELGEKVSKIKRQAPKLPTPAYIPLPTPPSGVSVLQAKLDALKRKGGRRKTRSKRRHHKKTLKH
jgi:hypothetical protein